jgi:hypothetical protein
MGLMGRIGLMCPIGLIRISGSRIELRWAVLARQRVEDEDEDDVEDEDDSRRLRDDMPRVYRPATPPHVPLWPDRFASSSYRSVSYSPLAITGPRKTPVGTKSTET